MQGDDVVSTQEEQRKEGRDLPEELVLVFHELRFDEVGSTCPYAETVKVADEEREEGMMGIELNLPCIQ